MHLRTGASLHKRRRAVTGARKRPRVHKRPAARVGSPGTRTASTKHALSKSLASVHERQPIHPQSMCECKRGTSQHLRLSCTRPTHLGCMLRPTLARPTKRSAHHAHLEQQVLGTTLPQRSCAATSDYCVHRESNRACRSDPKRRTPRTAACPPGMRMPRHRRRRHERPGQTCPRATQHALHHTSHARAPSQAADGTISKSRISPKIEPGPKCHSDPKYHLPFCQNQAREAPAEKKGLK